MASPSAQSVPASLTPAVIVNVQNAPLGAKLDAWIDFDGDGAWSGQSEQIGDSVAVSNGINTLFFAVPSSAGSGTTYARYRLSTQGDLGPNSAAPNGEVEDYILTIMPPTASPAVFAAPRPFDAASTRTLSYAHTIVDFDRDGDADIVSADLEEFYWQENIGEDRFATHALGAVIPSVDELQAADLDGDGDFDLAVASADAVAWVENIDGQLQVIHQLLDLEEGGTGGSQSGYGLAVADLDCDGDLDLVSGVRNSTPFGSEQADIYWHTNDGRGTFTNHYVDTIAAARNHSISELPIHIADMDRDGDPDIVVSADQDMVWYDNISLQFIERTISYLGLDSGARFDDAVVADFDSDGDADVISIDNHGTRISLHRNTGTAGQPQFYRSTRLTVAPFELSRLSNADMDGDGDLDLLVAGRISETGSVYLILNDGSGLFSPRIIAHLQNRFADPVAIDVDNDGDLDLAHSGLKWIENVNSANSGDFDGDGDVDGRDFLAWQRGASPTPQASDDLADWQATYGYAAPAPEVLAPLVVVDEPDGQEAPTAVLAESVVTSTNMRIVLPVSTIQVSREKSLLKRQFNLEQTHDRVFTQLGTPSKSFVRDFGDIAVRRTRPPRLSVRCNLDD